MPVTTAAIDLVDALFVAAVRNAVLSDSFSPHLRREVLWHAGGYVLDVWIGFNEWKYLIAQRRFEIGMTKFDETKFCHVNFDRVLITLMNSALFNSFTFCICIDSAN